MTDSISMLLRDVDAERPLPPGLVERIEAALEARPDASSPEPEMLPSRPMPPDLAASVEASVEAIVRASAVVAGADRPRPLPPEVRASLEAVLRRGIAGRARRRAMLVRATGAAASIVLMLTSLAAVRDGEAPGSALGDLAAAGSRAAGVGATISGEGAAADAADEASAQVAEEMARAYGPQYHVNAAPPFSAPAPFAAPAERIAGPAPSGPRNPVRIAVIADDPDQAAGFAAYLRLANERGVGRHRIVAVPSSDLDPAEGVLATVNLSDAPLAPRGAPPWWVTTPLLETLSVAESSLGGDVYSISSAVDRQAHLAVDAVLPGEARGRTVALFHERTGVWGRAVPDAFEAVLKAKGVAVLRVPYEAGRPTVFPVADAALLSLPPATARAWGKDAREAGYRPPLGIGGVYSLLSKRFARVAPTAAVVVSPYAFPRGAELHALERETGRAASAGTLHGWVTAKAIAVAIWRRDSVSSRADMRAALDALGGFESGLMPPYRLRPGTNSRVPEGLTYAISDGEFVARGGFRSDPW